MNFVKTVTLLFLLQSFSCLGQNIEYEKITLSNVSFYSKKSSILKFLGEPIETKEPNYDCGALSSEWEGNNIFQLIYYDFTFTGDDMYLIEKIKFQKAKKATLKYGDYTLNAKTTLKEAKCIFGNFKTRPSRFDELDEEVLLNGLINIDGELTLADDGIILTFKNGKLLRFDYWSPC